MCAWTVNDLLSVLYVLFLGYVSVVTDVGVRSVITESHPRFLPPVFTLPISGSLSPLSSPEYFHRHSSSAGLFMALSLCVFQGDKCSQAQQTRNCPSGVGEGKTRCDCGQVDRVGEQNRRPSGCHQEMRWSSRSHPQWGIITQLSLENKLSLVKTFVLGERHVLITLKDSSFFLFLEWAASCGYGSGSIRGGCLCIHAHTHCKCIQIHHWECFLWSPRPRLTIYLHYAIVNNTLMLWFQKGFILQSRFPNTQDQM